MATSTKNLFGALMLQRGFSPDVVNSFITTGLGETRALIEFLTTHLDNIPKLSGDFTLAGAQALVGRRSESDLLREVKLGTGTGVYYLNALAGLESFDKLPGSVVSQLGQTFLVKSGRNLAISSYAEVSRKIRSADPVFLSQVRGLYDGLGIVVEQIKPYPYALASLFKYMYVYGTEESATSSARSVQIKDLYRDVEPIESAIAPGSNGNLVRIYNAFVQTNSIVKNVLMSEKLRVQSHNDVSYLIYNLMQEKKIPVVVPHIAEGRDLTPPEFYVFNAATVSVADIYNLMKGRILPTDSNTSTIIAAWGRLSINSQSILDMLFFNEDYGHGRSKREASQMFRYALKHKIKSIVCDTTAHAEAVLKFARDSGVIKVYCQGGVEGGHSFDSSVCVTLLNEGHVLFQSHNWDISARKIHLPGGRLAVESLHNVHIAVLNGDDVVGVAGEQKLLTKLLRYWVPQFNVCPWSSRPVLISVLGADKPTKHLSTEQIARGSIGLQSSARAVINSFARQVLYQFFVQMITGAVTTKHWYVEMDPTDQGLAYANFSKTKDLSDTSVDSAAEFLKGLGISSTEGVVLRPAAAVMGSVADLLGAPGRARAATVTFANPAPAAGRGQPTVTARPPATAKVGGTKAKAKKRNSGAFAPAPAAPSGVNPSPAPPESVDDRAKRAQTETRREAATSAMAVEGADGAESAAGATTLNFDDFSASLAGASPPDGSSASPMTL